MKRAFTLVELLVVIGILGILIGALLPAISGSTDKARMVKCATNLKNLAAAAIAEKYPFAQSAQYVAADTSRMGNGICYRTHKGWISFLDRDTKYPLTSPGSFTQCSFAGDDEDVRYALTNGAIWKVMGGNRSSYLCPAFVDACRKVGVKNPGWSYQMSAYFGYEKESGAAKSTAGDGINQFVSRADRRLLFAEIPALELKSKDSAQTGVTSLPTVNLTGGSGTPECDSCLLYKSKGGEESIGFNHRRNRQLIGHVAFADGHVETIAAPKNGNFVDLTDWLCNATDVVYRDGSYEEIKDSETE